MKHYSDFLCFQANFVLFTRSTQNESIMKRPNPSVRLHIRFTSWKLAVFRFNTVLGAGIRKLGQPLTQFLHNIITISSTTSENRDLTECRSSCCRNVGLSTTNCLNNRTQCTKFDLRVYRHGDTDDTLLGAFAKFRKAISLCPSVRPPACPHGNTRFPLKFRFSLNFVGVSSKICRENSSLTKT